MCGLAGIVSRTAPPRDLLVQMARTLAHRGPDDEGLWSDDAAGIGLAHRRLSIVDLSPLGHQPMASNDGRWMLAYNGEIYNHRALRTALDAEVTTPWRGHSDTETLVECVAHWGLARTVERSVGMFALALWDRRERVLQLARDRFGEKPLYYGWVGGDFVFGSDLAALRRHPRFDNPVDRSALHSLTAYAYVAEPRSIYADIAKLPPGSILTAAAGALIDRPDGLPAPGEAARGIAIDRYWSYRTVVEAGLADPITDEAEALAELERTLVDAIAGQAVADVPVGAFLSGGIDSSLIVALYQKLWPGRVRTFTIGFDERGYDEAPFARRFAETLGTDHTEQYVSPHDAQEVIPRLPDIYSEPFADSSQIPTFLVAQLARRQVTVALSGDGGDELFAGYNRYFGTIRLWDAMQRAPGPLRRGAGRGLAAVPPELWNRLVALAPRGARPAFFGSRVRKVFDTLGRARSLEDFIGSFLDEWSGERSPVLGGAPLPLCDMAVAGAPNAARMMYCDAVSYLPGDILTKVDRASMAVSLEGRIPFLDHRVAAAAARIPLSMKIAGGQGKTILRRLLFQHVPAELFDRPKAGFAVPIGAWLRGPLRDWAEALLDPRLLRQGGYFDADVVRARWARHLAGEDCTAAIWSVLMFQAWLARDWRADVPSRETAMLSN